MDELMPPVGSVEKKAEFIRLLLSFLLRWIISFFPVQIPEKNSNCQRTTTLLLVVDFVDNIKWIYFFITFLSK
jgi:hypothetical protein